MKNRFQSYLGLVSMLLLAQLCFAASTVQFSSRLLTIAEDAGQAELTVVRANDPDTQVAVEFFCIEATATAGQDYTAVSGAVTFLPGETNHTIVVPILNDGHIEPLERFQVALTNVTGDAVLGTMRIATISIRDNESPVQLEFGDYRAREDEGSVQIGIVRGGDELEPLTLEIATADGSAFAGEDYEAVAAELTFEAGQNLKLLSVPILNDGIKEAEETFRVYLTNAPAGMLSASSTATIRIRDNDPGIEFMQNQLWVQQQENAVVLTVARGSDEPLSEFTVDYTTINGTAFAGIDYTETIGTLGFGTGEKARFITVPIIDDGVAKSDRAFKVVLSNPTGGTALGTAAKTTAAVTICDNREMQSHRFESVQVQPDGMVSLTLGGGFSPGVGFSNRFQPFFDIYPIEASGDLVHWSPLGWVLRTNAAVNVLAFNDPEVVGLAQRFYRTPGNCLIAPSLFPTGQYAVGRDDRLLTDSSRRNRYRISANSSFMVSIWYPAQREPGQLPATWDEEPMDRDPNWNGEWVDRWPSFRSYSVIGAPFAADLNDCPLVLFSHGLGDYRNDGLDKAENLASQGFVVVAMDHFDCYGTIFPDGQYILGGGDKTAANLPDRVRDMVFVMSELERWNEQDHLFAGKLHLQKVAAIGFSWGSESAVEFCRTEPRCQAAINLDEFDFSQAPGSLDKPTLTINNQGNGDLSIYDATKVESIWFQISDTRHGSFGAWYFAYGGSLQQLQQGHEAAGIINTYTLWFLNKYLKGSTEAMPIPTEFPRITNFKQK